MPKNLVIVESPAKAKTIQNYLGKDFQVLSSYGHIRDLPKKGMGIDIDNRFMPNYEISPDKEQVVKLLKASSAKADVVWLASDEDREGEAIAWHLFETLKLEETKTKRIVFHEITKSAILKAVQNPRKINLELVNAQQARRILDRIVGFEVSPVLWRKVKAGLSAGRVQSVAVRIIAEREAEIQKFVPEKFFRTITYFAANNGKSFKATLETNFTSEEQVLAYLESIKKAIFKVKKVVKKPGVRSSSSPFTTSSLQQEASGRLGFSVTRTMRLAQQLYEGGHITYMRTDSVNLSDDTILLAKSVIEKKYGKEYSSPTKYKNKNQNAQEAHEAIRPTNFLVDELDLDPSQNRLYKLIWQKAIASQMSDAKIEKTQISIENNKEESLFEAVGEVIVFDGFLKVYPQENLESAILPNVKEGEVLEKNIIESTEKYSKHPARFSEAALVKKLEELGIGRPSTYAPTINTIQVRKYVEIGDSEGTEREYKTIQLEKEEIKSVTAFEKHNSTKKKLVPTDIGLIVNEFLVNNFNNILDYSFTANIEESFDKIARGELDWNKMLGEFYKEFHPTVLNVLDNSERASGERYLGIDTASGKKVISRMGRFGPMIQVGDSSIEGEVLKYVSIPKNLSLASITFEQALKLFELPKELGFYKETPIEVNIGRYGPFIKHNDKYISIPKDEDPHSLLLERAIGLIVEKEKLDAPISTYDNVDITKGVGQFGPYIKWNGIFINVNKNYDFDNLSEADLQKLIEDKLVKESQKLIHEWKEEGVKVEKARWGRFNLIQGKIKIELPKETNVKEMKLEEFLLILEKKKPKPKVVTKKTTPKNSVKKSPKKSDK